MDWCYQIDVETGNILCVFTGKLPPPTCMYGNALDTVVVLQVRHEADLALKFLENHSMDSFAALFMTPVEFFRKFDVTFQ